MDVPQVQEHPCFDHEAHGRYARIHLPVAPQCNVQCVFCDRRVGDCYHSNRPGVTAKVMEPDEALAWLDEHVCDPRLRVVGIAGPGEPLANPQTFETLRLVHEKYPKLILCLSTNGLELAEYAPKLNELGVSTVTVTVNAMEPEVGSKIYSWVRYRGNNISGPKGAEYLSTRQWTGIERCVQLGMTVKLNTVLVPDVNLDQIELIAQRGAKAGVKLHNIIPIIPVGECSLRAPTKEEMQEARRMSRRHLEQFLRCKQCRADAVGVPGEVPTKPCHE